MEFQQRDLFQSQINLDQAEQRKATSAIVMLKLIPNVHLMVSLMLKNVWALAC